MRDTGLREAIDAMGGVSALARALGLSQPSVSNWDRIPAERVIAVEAATGVARGRLRPDLYAAQSVASEEDRSRAEEYRLLAALLRRAPTAELLAGLARLKGDSSPIGMAHLEMAQAVDDTNAEKVEREYFHLFVGLGRGEFLPYASWYMTGFLHDRPLARLREDLARLGIEVAAGPGEPEDHIAIVLEVMAGMADGSLGVEAKEERAFFDRHLRPWASRFFAELELSDKASFYKAVGLLGRVFLEIEGEAQGLAA
jgi:TorA maturation chaperone TorD